MFTTIRNSRVEIASGASPSAAIPAAIAVAVAVAMTKLTAASRGVWKNAMYTARTANDIAPNMPFNASALSSDAALMSTEADRTKTTDWRWVGHPFRSQNAAPRAHHTEMTTATASP